MIGDCVLANFCPALDHGGPQILPMRPRRFPGESIKRSWIDRGAVLPRTGRHRVDPGFYLLRSTSDGPAPRQLDPKRGHGSDADIDPELRSQKGAQGRSVGSSEGVQIPLPCQYSPPPVALRLVNTPPGGHPWGAGGGSWRAWGGSEVVLGVETAPRRPQN